MTGPNALAYTLDMQTHGIPVTFGGKPVDFQQAASLIASAGRLLARAAARAH